RKGASTAGTPVGRPRWLTRIKLPPWSRTYLSVGSAALIRRASEIEPSSPWGTLKSTRTRTFLPLRSRSRTVCLDTFGVLVGVRGEVDQPLTYEPSLAIRSAVRHE